MKVPEISKLRMGGDNRDAEIAKFVVSGVEPMTDIFIEALSLDELKSGTSSHRAQSLSAIRVVDLWRS